MATAHGQNEQMPDGMIVWQAVPSEESHTQRVGNNTRDLLAMGVAQMRPVPGFGFRPSSLGKTDLSSGRLAQTVSWIAPEIH